MFSWVLRKKLALKKIAGESRNEGIEMYRSIRRNAQGRHVSNMACKDHKLFINFI